MYPRPIQHYYAPRELDEALRLRARHGATCVVLAGGQSLVPAMKARTVAPEAVLDLNRVAGLERLEVGDDVVRIGALVRHRTAAAHPELRRCAGVLSDAADTIGDLQVRNRGTLVGSLCHADPCGDIAPAALALGGALRVAGGPNGERLMPLLELFRLPLQAPELALALEFPRPVAASAGAFRKFGRVAQDRATVSVAVQLQRGDSHGTCGRAAIVVGGLLPAPQIARDAAAGLQGQALDGRAFAAAAECAVAELHPQDDALASADYRRELVRALVIDTLACAARRLDERDA